MATAYLRGILAVALTLGALTAAAHPARAGIGSAGLTTEVDSVYTVDVAAGVVRVEESITISHRRGDDVYWPSVGFPVLAEARNFGATSDGRRTSVTREAGNDTYAYAIIDVEPDLLPGETRTLRLTYDLTSQPPRSESFTRINPAFAMFAAFNVGDPGVSSVEVRVPAGFDVESSGADVETTTQDDGTTVLRSGDIDDPSSWVLAVVARNDEGLLSRPLSLGDRNVVVRAWPGDDEWGAFVEQQLTGGVLILEKMIGLEWPTDDELTIIEAASPYLYGYAGWFEPTTNVIEIGDALDAQVILHEVAHLWFNDALFTERWMGEAFAEEFAWRTRVQMGEAPAGPDPVDRAAPGAGPLAEWGQPLLTDETIRERETWSYNASFAVLHGIVDEIGIDAMAPVIAAIDAESIAYVGDPDPESTGIDVDSRRLLDILQEIGGSTTAPTAFEQYVFDEADKALLPAREAARMRYTALVDAGDGWSAPFEVREAMAAWNFDKAEDLADEAQAVLDVRDDVVATTDELGLDLPAEFEAAYEETDDIEEVADLADEVEDAADAIAEADAAVNDTHGFVTRIGLLGDDPDALLEEATAAFEDGSLTTALVKARRATRTVDDAAGAGRLRLGLAAVALVAAFVLLWFGVRRARQRRERSKPEEWVGSPPWS